MDDGGFYLTLPSNSSLDQYPDNGPNHFYTKLQRPIDLSGKNFEVGLAEIQFPNTWSNLPPDLFFMFQNSEYGSAAQIRYIPDGMYDEPEKLVKEINKLMKYTYKTDSSSAQSRLIFDKMTKTVIVKINKENEWIEFSKELADLLHLPTWPLRGEDKSRFIITLMS